MCTERVNRCEGHGKCGNPYMWRDPIPLSICLLQSLSPLFRTFWPLGLCNGWLTFLYLQELFPAQCDGFLERERGGAI